MTQSGEQSGETARLQPIIGPLSDQEQLAAHEAVRRHLAQRSTRYRIVGPELLIDKPPSRGASSTRQIRALVIDYDNMANLQIVMQPGGDIVDAKRLDWQPPFTAEEIDEARQIAESDERVARVARQEGVSVITFGPPASATSAAGTMPRLIGLRYIMTVEARTRLVQAVVNLSTRTLGEVQESEQ
jgi:hypothetical protein